MFVLRKIQRLPITIQTAWDFFSSPRNLKQITPEYMGFDITSDFPDEKMYPGMIVMYKVKPLLNLSLNWTTEITQVREPYFFVDEQRSGPYKFWHHQHKFNVIKDGVEIEDIVHYDLPFWIVGNLVERIVVRNKLEKIFDYRAEKLNSVFGTYKN